MRISDQISMCLSNLLHRKMRTLLTITGVVVGTCLIVIVFSLGIATNLRQEVMLAGMGDLTRITVYSNGFMGDSERVILNDDAIAKIAALPGVDVATPMYSPRNMSLAIYGGKEDRYKMEYIDLQGVYAEAMPKLGYELLSGEYPKAQPNPKKPVHVLIGEYTDFNFEDTKKKLNNWRWPQQDKDGKLIQKPFVNMERDDILLKSVKVDEDAPDSTVISREIKVAGRLKEDYNKGYYGGILMDINDIKQLEEAYNKANKIKVSKQEKEAGYNRAVVVAKTIDDVDAVSESIKGMGFEADSLEKVRKEMQDNVRQQQLFLGILGGVSLVVAAIGITNTMIMSIYERTREIGVMKVLGCKVGNIRTIFLMEAGTIGFLGGIAGTALSFAASHAMNFFKFSIGGSGQNDMYQYGYYGFYEGADPSTMPVSVIPLWLVGLAIVFATFIGLLSGVLPANRAMKISALEAIKHE